MGPRPWYHSLGSCRPPGFLVPDQQGILRPVDNLANPIPHAPAPKSPRNTPSPYSRALRTIAALGTGLALGSATADVASDKPTSWLTLSLFLAPAFYALIEAIADRIAGRISNRSTRRRGPS